MKIGVFCLTYQQYEVEHGVRQSELKLLSQSPAHLKWHREHPDESTPDQIAGSVFHCALLEPGLLPQYCHVRPKSYPGDKGEEKPWHSGSNWCKKWLAEHRDLPVIPAETFTDVLAMTGAARKHPAAALALRKRGLFEHSMFCEDAETGLQLKCRPDLIVGNAIIDAKKCQDASPEGFSRTVANYGYDVQAVFYLHVARVLRLGIQHFVFIAVEDQPPYATGVYELDTDSLEIGHQKFRRLLGIYQRCVIDDKWPGYSDNVEFLTLPTWSKRQTEAMLEADARDPREPALRVQ